MEIFQIICNSIILLGGAAGAVVAILSLLGKPVKFFQKRRQKLMEKQCDEMAAKVAEKVKKSLTPQFDEIHQQNLEQSEAIHILTQSSKDMLRQAILAIYNDHKAERKLTETMRELLDDLYADYKAEKGNHYIDKIYRRMIKWEIVPDDDLP